MKKSALGALMLPLVFTHASSQIATADPVPPPEPKLRYITALREPLTLQGPLGQKITIPPHAAFIDAASGKHYLLNCRQMSKGIDALIIGLHAEPAAPEEKVLRDTISTLGEGLKGLGCKSFEA